MLAFAVQAQSWGDFQVEAAEPRLDTKVDEFVAKLEANAFPRQRIEMLRKDVDSSPLGYTGPQTVRILKAFDTSTEKAEAIQIMDEHILGMTSENVIEAISTAQFYSHKLIILEALRSTITDEDRRYSILDAFTTQRDKAKAKEILDRIQRPRSFIYGTIISKHVVFVVDFSGSMEAKFQLSNGRSVNRLDFVRYELEKAVSILPADITIDVVMFSSGVQAWKGRLTSATADAKKSALSFANKFSPEGATNIHGALRDAFSDKSVETIYFLTDGVPTTGDVEDEGQILDNVMRWNSGRNVRIHTCAFLMGSYGGDDKPRSKTFMKLLAERTGGVYRAFE